MSDAMLLGVLRMPVNENDPLFMGQFVSRAREAANRIESDAREITTLRQQLEQAEARVAEYQESITAFVAENERLQAEFDQVEAVSPSAILRKQAEAVEAIKDFKIVAYGSTGVAVDVYEILKYAQRFRNQADELEKTGGSDA